MQPTFFEPLESRSYLSVTWGVQGQQVSQNLAAIHFPKIDGSHESIAVIDSGVDYTHPLLGGTFGSRRSKVVAGWNFVEKSPDPSPPDQNWHGTATAAIAAGLGYTNGGRYFQGIAPAAHIVGLRAFPGHVADALKWIIANRSTYNIVAVELLSPAGHTSGLIQTLNSQGVFISEPSGNSGPTQVAGHYDGIYMVGSTDADGTISSFTQRGPNLDLVPPGNNVMVAWNQAGMHTEMPGQGTSWAAPQVAGAAALLKQINPAITPRQIMGILKRTGTPIHDTVSGLTYEQLNLDGALTVAAASKRASEKAQPVEPSLVLVPPVSFNYIASEKPAQDDLF